ncbi:unnamed protein product [Tetraodon nigroviridis]|uniref:(spotted green pufferfish) hypothetical protein n=1 Tax=Tetraodon nigroviridis TaxID=99883 RepID=Q4RLW9_TETNG|nr:unnamed protein product [Tetraodon nigroviridis]
MEWPQMRKQMIRVKQVFNLETIREDEEDEVVFAPAGAIAKQGSLHVSHTTAQKLIGGLDDLKSNHSHVMEVKEKAKTTLEAAHKNHTEMKRQIAELKTVNDKYQQQTEVLEQERASLKANYTVLSEAENRAIKKNWEDSRQDCIRRGADLVVIDRPEEQTFVSHTIETMVTGKYFWDNSFWIGLKDEEVEGTWVWINNVTEVEQRYWIQGEPNNYGPSTGEDCAAFVNIKNPRQTWYDASCSEEKHWLCETEPNT